MSDKLDEGLNRLRKGGVNAPPPEDARPPSAPPPQRLSRHFTDEAVAAGVFPKHGGPSAVATCSPRAEPVVLAEVWVVFDGSGGPEIAYTTESPAAREAMMYPRSRGYCRVSVIGAPQPPRPAPRESDLRCPFCGSPPRPITDIYPDNREGLVSCPTRDCPAGAAWVKRARWNKRAPVALEDSHG